MPELPEITVLACDMQKELLGRRISGVELLQPKCLNIPEAEFRTALTGAEILAVAPHGTWLEVETLKVGPRRFPLESHPTERSSHRSGWAWLSSGRLFTPVDRSSSGDCP